MDEFNWEEIEVALNEQAGLEHKMFQLNGIAEVLETGNVNRELAQLAIELDADWFSTEQYPLGSFTSDYSVTNHEVLMTNWTKVALNLSNQLSGVSLRVALLVAGAVLWLISRVRKKGKGGDNSSGGSADSSSSSSGGRYDPVREIQEQFKRLEDLAASDMTMNRSITTALGELNTDGSKIVRAVAGKKKVDWSDILVKVTELVNAAENIIAVAERQGKMLEAIIETSSVSAKYKVPKTSGKNTVHLISSADITNMMKTFNRNVKELSRDVNGQLITETYCRTGLNNTVGKYGLDVALLAPHLVSDSIGKMNKVNAENFLTGEIELHERSPSADVVAAFTDIQNGTYSQRGQHTPKNCGGRSVAVVDWAKTVTPARNTGVGSPLKTVVHSDNFLAAFVEFGNDTSKLDKLESQAKSLRDNATDALKNLDKQTDELFNNPLLVRGSRNSISIQLPKGKLEDLLPSNMSFGDATREREVLMQLDPSVAALTRFAIHNKKGLLNFASNLCLDRVTKTCKYISDEISYAEHLLRELPKIKTAN